MSKCFGDARDGRGLVDRAFLHPDDGPTVAPEGLRNAPVTRAIVLDLATPKFGVRARQVFASATMPEAAVYENGYLTPGPGEIGFAENRPVLTIAPQAGGP